MKTYPHLENGEIIELVRKDEHDAVVRELKKHLEDANRGAERNAHINRSFAGQINQLHSDIRELNERLTKQQADMLDTIVQLRLELTRWQSLAESLASALESSAKLYENPEPPSMHELSMRAYDMRCIARTALAAYNSAKSGNLPDPLAEAVKRMEEVSKDEILEIWMTRTRLEWTFDDAMENVRARLISAAKGEQP